MSTATEVEMRIAEQMPKFDIARQALHGLSTRLLEGYTAAFLGPRRKRWDQFGAYYRRQLKKWRKRNSGFTIFLSSVAGETDWGWCQKAAIDMYTYGQSVTYLPNDGSEPRHVPHSEWWLP